jgi:uncharacterized membrane protein
MDTQAKIAELELKAQILQIEIQQLKLQIGHGENRPIPQRIEAPIKKQEKAALDWEHLITRIWLPRIFILVLLVGVLWGFSAAVSAGIVTKPVRCLLGLLGMGVLYWQGETQIKRNRAALGQVLIGGSISLGVLTIFAAHMLYGYLSPAFAFMGNIAAISIGVYLSIRHKSQAMMILSAVGGFLVPFLVDTHTPNFWVFTVYESLLSVTLLFLALAYRFSYLYYLSFALLHLALAIGAIEGHIWSSQSELSFLAAVSFQHLALFYFFITKQTQEKSKMTLLFASFTLISLWVGTLKPQWFEAFALVLSILYSLWTLFGVRKHRQETVLTMSIATFGWALYLAEITSGQHFALLLLIEGFLAIALGIFFKSKLQKVTGSAVYAFGTFLILSREIEAIASLQTLSFIVLIASVLALYTLFKKSTEGGGKRLQWFLWADSILGLWFLTQVTQALVQDIDYDMQHLAVSFVWAFYAIAIVTNGIWRNRKQVRLAGISFLFITLLKIIIVDLPGVSIAIRAVLFIALGCAGILVSRFSYKK